MRQSDRLCDGSAQMSESAGLELSFHLAADIAIEDEELARIRVWWKGSFRNATSRRYRTTQQRESCPLQMTE